MVKASRTSGILPKPGQGACKNQNSAAVPPGPGGTATTSSMSFPPFMTAPTEPALRNFLTSIGMPKNFEELGAEEEDCTNIYKLML